MRRWHEKYRLPLVVLMATLLALAACGKRQDPLQAALNDNEVITTLNNFIQTEQQNCIAMPITLDTPVTKNYVHFTDPNGAQLAALVKAGLIWEHRVKTGQIRFSVSAQGKAAYDGNTPPGFCSGTPEVEKVLSNTVEESRDNYSRNKIVFTTRLMGISDWARNKEIRQQYPKFATLLDNQGKEQHIVEIESRGQGWRVLEPGPLGN